MRQTHDLARVASVLKHPAIFRFIGDDFTPHDWQPQRGPVYLMPDNNGACLSFMPRTAVLWEVHAAVLPRHLRRSVEYGRGAIDWMRQNTRCACIEAYTYEGRGVGLLTRLGFKAIGLLPASKQRGGVLIDQTIYALGI